MRKLERLTLHRVHSHIHEAKGVWVGVRPQPPEPHKTVGGLIVRRSSASVEVFSTLHCLVPHDPRTRRSPPRRTWLHALARAEDAVKAKSHRPFFDEFVVTVAQVSFR